MENVKQEDGGCAIFRGWMCTAVTDVGELHNYLLCVGFVRLASSWKQADEGSFLVCVQLLCGICGGQITRSTGARFVQEQRFCPCCCHVASRPCLLVVQWTGNGPIRRRLKMRQPGRHTALSSWRCLLLFCVTTATGDW